MRMIGRFVRGVVGPVATLVILVTNPSAAQTNSLFDRLATLGVHVTGVSPAAAALGVDTVALRHQIERQLRGDGFTIYTRIDLLEHPETPRLVLNLGSFNTSDSFVYSALLELLEEVKLERNGLQTYAAGWSHQVIGIAPDSAAALAAQNAADRLVTLFLADRRSPTDTTDVANRPPPR